jgi:hypothetical protein
MAVRRPDDTLDLFLRGTADDVIHNHFDHGGNLLAWESVGGIIKGAPDAKWSADGTRLDIFVIGTSDQPWVRTWTNTAGWGSWTPITSAKWG